MDTAYLSGSIWSGLFLVLIGTLYALVALWLVEGRAGWLARCAPLLLLFAALMPIGAYDLLLIFGSQAFVIVGVLSPLRIGQRWRRMGRTEPCLETGARPAGIERVFTLPRFRLIDVLKAVFVMASALAMVRLAPSAQFGWLEDRFEWVGLGATWGIVTLSVYSLEKLGRHWYLALLGLTGASIVSGMITYDLTGRIILGSTNWFLRLSWIASVSLVQGLLTFAVLRLSSLAGWSKQFPSGAVADAAAVPVRATPLLKTSRVARIGLCLLIVAVSGFLGRVYWLLLPPRVPAAESLPVPNGYNMLLSAEFDILWTIAPDFDEDKVSADECQKFVETNAAPLALVRGALHTPSRAAMDYHNPDLTFDEPYFILDLARALLAEGKAQSSAGKHDEAARTYVDQLQLAYHCRYGGTVRHELVANSIEEMAFDNLYKNLYHLNASQLAAHRAQVQTILTPREPLETVFARDREYCLAAFGWQARLLNWAMPEYLTPPAGVTESARQRNETLESLLTTHMAVRQYQLERGHLPESLAQLVSGYLPAEPRDPYTGGLLIYRLAKDRYVLYSVGANKIDDGGPPIRSSEAIEDGIDDVFLGTG